MYDWLTCFSRKIVCKIVPVIIFSINYCSSVLSRCFFLSRPNCSSSSLESTLTPSFSVLLASKLVHSPPWHWIYALPRGNENYLGFFIRAKEGKCRALLPFLHNLRVNNWQVPLWLFKQEPCLLVLVNLLTIFSTYFIEYWDFERIQ